MVSVGNQPYEWHQVHIVEPGRTALHWHHPCKYYGRQKTETILESYLSCPINSTITVSFL